ncbi:MAG: valine--tRNA ligase [Candidatus Moraniibacteriota bacterium]|nr:MAG: valine--tRNA ligase [Candidatus Moranbacteria bacterium]
MHEKYTKPYDHTTVEKEIYRTWEESGYFNPDNLPGERTETFSIIMPPPNANGRLHAGHGSDFVLKDIMGRYHRMCGKKVLLLPGADHAGFETQGVYEKKLQKEGRSRFGMERQELYDEIYQFVMDHKHIMEDDVKKLGTSCDWSRNTFTLDERVITQVEKTFIKMYNDGIIYRGKRSIHWNPKFKTSLADIETTFEDRTEPFYYFQYGPFEIGTSRPETKFGDKYVVMHPDDERYAQYKEGDTFEAEWLNGTVTATVIKDEAIDMEFGTGVMTITPWHDPVDFEIAQRHNLSYEQIIDLDGRLMDIAGEFAGEKIHIARPKVVEKLKEKGLLTRVEEKHTHAVRVCERTGVVIEPQLMDQWFVTMKPLTERALAALADKKISFVSEQFEKIFVHWMENPIDWNISRQIVWGIQIPAWFKNKGTEQEEIAVQKEKPDGDGWEQDTDTFDTWFSSGQWPLLTLGYPDGKDFAEYYPTNVMETGRDLVFKWVPRMIMFGLYLADDVPFKDIYFHGMVLDGKGQKMSKSKGNTLSPVELADEFGTDAMRMSFIVGNTPGRDMALTVDKVRAYKKFANKLWNITRFVYQHADGCDYDNFDAHTLTETETAHIDTLHKIKTEIAEDIENYRLYLGAEKAYHYVWHTLADQVLEESKDALFDKTIKEDKTNKTYMLLALLEETLTLLHPFMPFITEEIWKDFPKKEKDLLIVEPW